MKTLAVAVDAHGPVCAQLVTALQSHGFTVAQPEDDAVVRISPRGEEVLIAFDGAPPIRLPRSTAPAEAARVARLLVERDELERALHEAEAAACTSLVAPTLLHDANNMLSLILTTLSLESRGGDPSLDSRATITDATRRLASILRRLTSHQRTSSQLRRTSVNVVVASLVPMLRSLATDRVLATRLDSDLPSIRVDPVDLERAIVNLVKNAIDATGSGDRILIGAQRIEVVDGAPSELHAGQWVHLFVEDRGAGMPPETLAKATDPFFTTKSSRGGSGLGLVSVSRIVRAAGGHLKIASVHGLGTTVHLLFPASADRDGRPPVQPTNA